MSHKNRQKGEFKQTSYKSEQNKQYNFGEEEKKMNNYSDKKYEKEQ